MKKRVLCLLLCLLTLLCVALTGCSQGEDINTDSNVNSSRTPVTLNMWIISENQISEETEKAVENAFNAITEATYTTHVDLIFCTAEEYEAKLNAKFATIDAKPAGTSIKPPTKAETYVDEDGMTVLKYPTASEYQLDILLIAGEKMLNKYVAEGRLTSLDESLVNQYRVISSYIYNDVMDNAKVNGSWYAVPNNNVIGSYTYMLVNRAMAEKYYYNESDFTSFGLNTAAAQLIEKIAKNEDRSVIAPMYGMADYPLAKYWSKNGDAPSIISTMYLSANEGIGNGVSAVNLFKDAGYKTFMQEMFHCKENGYFRDQQETFGVAIMEGDYSVYQQYIDDYYVVPLAYPRLEEDAVFGSMFAVSTSTASLARSMEIIKELTCRSELRNVLQYGVEDVHYRLDDDGVLHRLNHDYMMNIRYTGNVLMAHPEEGMSADAWNNAILQNRESLVSKVFGSGSFLSRVDADAWNQMSEISVAYFDRLYRCETGSEFEEYLRVAAREIESSSYYAKMVGTDETTLNGALAKWWMETFGSKA